MSSTSPRTPPPPAYFSRLAHPHYILNALLCIWFPLLLLGAAPRATVDHTTLLALLAGPILLVTTVLTRSGLQDAETNFELVSWNLKVFALCGMWFTRMVMQLSPWHTAAYLGVWLLVSFFFPQPPYLGPNKLHRLTSEQFDTHVLHLPPATPFDPSPTPKIIELDETTSSSSQASSSSLPPTDKETTSHLVLFHAEWSRKSRELEITLSRLSYLYTSPTLSFHLLDSELCPSTFYDLSLSVAPSSLDLPQLRLYRNGKEEVRMPEGVEGVKERRERERLVKRAKKRLEREREEREREKVGEGTAEESESGSETDWSDEEREAEKEVQVGRYKWDRSADAIVRTFRLKERSDPTLIGKEGKKKQ